ncbi:MAG: histidine--tRNA ligase [Candidatus Micrarchaeota archaeon]|nr:histidine--tRNA ligase [Candidatus Micrarchaeota archaeon]
MPISQPRGVRDFGPGESIARKRIIAVVEETFKRFGFSPIETPALESMEVLNAKAYGEESAKQFYKIDGDDSALRFDLTIPMARYIAMNSNMPLPFKRYQIGQTWRRDEPQKMRYREFTQADVDIVGSEGVECDAEVIAAVAIALEELKLTDYKILINSRVILDAVLDSFGVQKEKQPQIIRIIDKLEKIGRREVTSQIQELGVEQRAAERIVEFITEGGNDEETIGKVAANTPGTKAEFERLKSLMELLAAYKLQGSVAFSPSLARGFDYYTGFVWEFVVYYEGKLLPTLAAGGRYNNLLELYAKKSVPAVGCSIGIDRVFDVIEGKPMMSTYAKLFVGTIGDENYGYALSVANSARAAGVYTDINMTRRNISKQLEYANALKFRYAIIVGSQEKAANNVKLRDLVSGEEESLPLSEAIGKMTMKE